MTKAISIATFKNDTDAINCCTVESLQNAVTKAAWKMFNEIEGIKYDGYNSCGSMKYDDCNVVVLVRSSDGIVLDKYSTYYGCSEWRAICNICKEFLKIGNKATDFKILFMTEGEYKSLAKFAAIKGMPHHRFEV